MPQPQSDIEMRVASATDRLGKLLLDKIPSGLSSFAEISALNPFGEQIEIDLETIVSSVPIIDDSALMVRAVAVYVIFSATRDRMLLQKVADLPTAISDKFVKQLDEFVWSVRHSIHDLDDRICTHLVDDELIRLAGEAMMEGKIKGLAPPAG